MSGTHRHAASSPGPPGTARAPPLPTSTQSCPSDSVKGPLPGVSPALSPPHRALATPNVEDGGDTAPPPKGAWRGLCQSFIGVEHVRCYRVWGLRRPSSAAAQPWAPLRQRQQVKGTGLRRGGRKRKTEVCGRGVAGPPTKDPRHLQPDPRYANPLTPDTANSWPQTCDEPAFSAQAPAGPAFAKRRAVPVSVSKVGLGWGRSVHTGPPPRPLETGAPPSQGREASAGERVDQDHGCA